MTYSRNAEFCALVDMAELGGLVRGRSRDEEVARLARALATVPSAALGRMLVAYIATPDPGWGGRSLDGFPGGVAEVGVRPVGET